MDIRIFWSEILKTYQEIDIKSIWRCALYQNRNNICIHTLHFNQFAIKKIKYIVKRLEDIFN